MTALWNSRDYKDGDRMDEFPERLRRLRESMRPVRSMTVTSQLMGLSPDALRKYERGEVEPK